MDRPSRFARSRSRVLGVMLAGLVAPAGFAAEVSGPHSPADELATFEFADALLTAEPVASEPLVASPVALAWDADGRMFVAEMRDYPNAKGGGAIRMLEDRDRDGRYETSRVFADRVPFPNSVLPWNGGVMVTAAPDLWYLRDTDDDGHADERRVLFTGFGTGNQQLRANGLFWGLDGWVYGANGRSDGEIRWVGDSNPSDSASRKGISIRGRDFRFRPDTGVFETLAGRSQFGLARDDWGNRFLSWNTIPVRHEVFPDHFLTRNPNLSVSDVLQDCLPAGDVGRIFPRSPAPRIFNNESGEHFNALSGLHIFRGDALGAEYAGQAWVGESLRNLVHRRVLVPDGPTFRAERDETNREFLASTDPWFHPVNFATGPDGALYISDFYRNFVEHPDWVAPEMRTRVAWSQGSEYGRIWRVRRKDRPPTASSIRPAMTSLSTTQLVDQLSSANGWRRDTAQRLLLERRDPVSVAALERQVREGSRPETRLAALFTLEALGTLRPETLQISLVDQHPRVRAAGVQVAGRQLAQTINNRPDSESANRESLAQRILQLTTDADETVRLQIALALGNLSAGSARESALEKMALATTNRWLLLALASSSQSTNAVARYSAVTSKPIARLPAVLRDPDPDRERVIQQFRPALKLPGDRARGASICAQRCLSCHYLQGHGQRVGPDLSGLAARPVEILLMDILDPNHQVAPDYIAYEIAVKDGRKAIGLIASETETRVTLRYPSAPDESFARDQLREIRPTGRSLMPDGLEAELSESNMADLLAFLRAPDGELLPKE